MHLLFQKWLGKLTSSKLPIVKKHLFTYKEMCAFFTLGEGFYSAKTHPHYYRAQSPSMRRAIFQELVDHYPEHCRWLWFAMIEERNESKYSTIRWMRSKLKDNTVFQLYCAGVANALVSEEFLYEKSFLKKERTFVQKNRSQLRETWETIMEPSDRDTYALRKLLKSWPLFKEKHPEMTLTHLMLTSLDGLNGIDADLLYYLMSYMSGDIYQMDYPAVLSLNMRILDTLMSRDITWQDYETLWIHEGESVRFCFSSFSCVSIIQVLLDPSLPWREPMRSYSYVYQLLKNIYQIARVAPSSVSWGFSAPFSHQNINGLTKDVCLICPEFFIHYPQYMPFIEQVEQSRAYKQSHPSLLWYWYRREGHDDIQYIERIKDTVMNITDWPCDEVIKLLILKGVDCLEFEKWEHPRKELIQMQVDVGIPLKEAFQLLVEEVPDVAHTQEDILYF